MRQARPDRGCSLVPGVDWQSDPYAAAKDADLIVLLTEWNEFRALDLSQIAGDMRRPAMADLRNIYSAQVARDAGFAAYEAVGRSGFADDHFQIEERLAS